MKKDCLSTRDLESYVDRTLSPERQAEIESHLDACADCRSKILALQSTETIETAINVRDNLKTGCDLEIDGYEIVSEISRGGQGVVYKAIQTATKRVVALKVLRAGTLATSKEMVRFEREVELAASMDHPNIATVYESGVADGQPFLVMKYVRGKPLTEFLRENRIEIREALALFEKICRAVAYAHSRGVIHRDLKPTNILVDQEAEPHILDFGLAKAAGTGFGSDGHPLSVTGEFMGTLAYASPEQTKGDPSLIDVRTDVYSLGVILFEMLTREFPYQVIGRLADVLKNICDEPPKKPSSIRRKLGDEVETIILKSLAKERDRRYQTVDALRSDVVRFLSGQPIDAKRDSGWYVLRKTVSKYRWPVLATAASIAALVVFALAMTVQSNRIAAERDRADYQSYLANISAAYSSLQLHDVGNARRYLSRCSTDSRGWEWFLLDNMSDQSTRVFSDFGEGVIDIALSPDGTVVAGASWDSRIRVIHVQSGQVLSSISLEGDSASALAFDREGKRLVSGMQDGTVCLWDPTTGRSLGVLSPHASVVQAVSFMPDGRHAMSISKDQLTVWSTGDMVRAAIRTLQLSAEFESVSISPDVSQVAGVFWGDSSVRVFNLVEGNQPELTVDKTLRVDTPVFMPGRPAFSPDGKRLFVATDGFGNAVIWDLKGKEGSVHIEGDGDPVTAACFGPAGRYVYLGRWDNVVEVYDSRSGRQVATLVGHERPVRSLAVSADGRRLATGAGDESVRIWNISQLETPPVIEVREGLELRLGPEIEREISVFVIRDDAVAVVAKKTGFKELVIPVQVKGKNSVAISSDGSRLAVGDDEGGISIWDVSSGKKIRHIADSVPQSEADVYSLNFSPDEELIASGHGNGDVQVWDLNTGQLRAKCRGHSEAVNDVHFDPAGRRIVTCSRDGTVRIFDVSAGGDALFVLENNQEAGRKIAAFSSDGNRIATGGWPEGIQVWDASNGSRVASFVGSNPFIKSLAFNGDGSRVASIAWEDTIRLWDSENGELLLSLETPGPEWFEDIRFSADGRTLYSISQKGFVKKWETSIP